MQRSREALADARKNIRRESKAKNEDTVAALCQRHNFILLCYFFDVFYF